MVGELTTHPAVGAERIDLGRGGCRGAQAGWPQCAGWACLDALAAADAGAVAHGVGHVEDHGSLCAATGEADHVVDLHLAAGAQAPGAVDARVEPDVDSRMRAIFGRWHTRWKPARFELQIHAAALAPAVRTSDVPVLTDNSTCSCMWAGTIEVVEPGSSGLETD